MNSVKNFSGISKRSFGDLDILKATTTVLMMVMTKIFLLKLQPRKMSMKPSSN